MKSLQKKIQSNKGESLAEAMASMVLLAFAIIVFSAMIIQSSRLMSRGEKNMDYYEAGQNALNARNTESEYIRMSEAKLNITGVNGENDFSGLTPALRTGEGNEISVKLYRQQLDWSRTGNEASSNALFTYDLAAYADSAESGSDGNLTQNDADESTNG